MDSSPETAKWTVRAGQFIDELTQAVLEAFNRIRLPAPSVLPVAGAVVGLYSGLAAGVFANMIGLVSGVALAPLEVLALLRPGSDSLRALWEAFRSANWHVEYAIIGVPLAGAALLLARLIEPGGPRDEVKRRLRVLALLVLGALGLYYPLVALSALNEVVGHSHEMVGALQHLPFWAMLLSPAIGGMIVGRLLRDRPETHGHGVPEVVMAVNRHGQGLSAENGLLKLLGSAVTIGSGGSAGREGPIVYGGAAFASSVARTLGFSRKELSILLACGAGAGISASFNAPIAGAVFAMEIILRQFEIKVFSPIILASVTATMVSRGVMGSAPMLRRIGYQMVSGWEILGYVALGLICGFLAYAFVTLYHRTEGFFQGHHRSPLSAWLGRQSLFVRAGIGGLLVGGMALINPVVWGSGHDFVNQAAVRQLGFWFLLSGCVLKLIATAVTLGSGGSGGTFFPATVIGAMAGGVFGEILHDLLPTATAPSGAYAMVGMGGAVAGLTRGPLTGMMMLYELSGNYAIILPLMVTCTIASALCHYLVERRAVRVRTDADVMGQTKVRELLLPVTPVSAQTHVKPLVDQLLVAEEGALPVLDAQGRMYGVVQVEHLRDVWREDSVHSLLVAIDLAHPVPMISADCDLITALEVMDREDVDALPVLNGEQGYGLITRSRVRRYLTSLRSKRHQEADQPVAATEVSD